jgi:hypothetical protein
MKSRLSQKVSAMHEPSPHHVEESMQERKGLQSIVSCSIFNGLTFARDMERYAVSDVHMVFITVSMSARNLASSACRVDSVYNV